MRSWSNKVLAIRRVTQDNRGQKTAGVDGKKSLSPEARLRLIGQLKLIGKSRPTRRVWIPKPGKDEKRPLGIPTMHDRALQALLKHAIEPEWEALFESNSYGFRPGRSCQDAIKQIKNAIQSKAKYVLDADIAKCFDKINHLALLQKLGYTGKFRQQLKAWLKSGVIDQKVFTATSEGTPQGGVISPLLANVALHGMEKMLMKFAKTLDVKRKDKPNSQISWQQKVKSLTFIRYADDFLLIHHDLNVVKRCRELISEWLKDMGLELKPSKTRIAHTLISEQSEDGQAGFDFLGYHIRQFRVGKYKSSIHPSTKEKLGFRTFIIPSKFACKKHQQKIKDVFKKHKYSHQAKLIVEAHGSLDASRLSAVACLQLNPIIRGWTNYYSFSDAQGTGVLTGQDYLVFQKLRAWSRHRTGDWGKAIKKYWTTIGNRNWVFATRKGDKNPLRLLTHTEFGSSSIEYVKVKGDASPFDGKLIYWNTRMGRSPDMPSRKALLLKRQKGVCSWCCLRFREGDLLETDHNIPRALGGKDEYKNLQLLHGHCHDEKTALDMEFIRNQRFIKYMDYINQTLAKSNWLWNENDFLIVSYNKE